jgi:hypothetical protein
MAEKTNETSETHAILCACVSVDAERCIVLRYPAAFVAQTDGDDEAVERCECSCHDFQRYDE